MKPLPFKTVKRKLERAGFVAVSQKGSHVKFAGLIGSHTRIVIVPKSKDVPPGTLRSIIRQAGISPEEFERL